MTAQIIDLRSANRAVDPPTLGNGAREALIDIGENCPFHVDSEVAMHWADDVLMQLAMRGFKVVPLEEPVPA